MGAFDGKVAIVTGSARGLGRDYATFFADDGAAVVVADINAEGAQQAAKEIESGGGRAIGTGVDVTDLSSASAMVETAARDLGGVDILVNNAGIWGDLQGTFDPFLDTDVDYFKLVLDVNLVGAFICSKAAAPLMQQKGWGRIVNISSIGAWMAGGVYGVSKLALNQLTYATATQLGDHGITVNAVAPGAIHNEATQRQVPDQFFEMMVQQQPIKRAGTSRDMYGAIRWLCTDDAAWVTAQVISPNGGSHARF